MAAGTGSTRPPCQPCRHVFDHLPVCIRADDAVAHQRVEVHPQGLRTHLAGNGCPNRRTLGGEPFLPVGRAPDFPIGLAGHDGLRGLTGPALLRLSGRAKRLGPPRQVLGRQFVGSRQAADRQKVAVNCMRPACVERLRAVTTSARPCPCGSPDRLKSLKAPVLDRGERCTGCVQRGHVQKRSGRAPSRRAFWQIRAWSID
jgi:hypothetical protein